MTDSASKKINSRAAKTAPPSGRAVPVRTNSELLADMQTHGREIRKTKESALAFLKSAGIANAKGELAKPYRV